MAQKVARTLDAGGLDRRKVVGDAECGARRTRDGPPRFGGDPGRFRRGQRLTASLGQGQGPVRIPEKKRRIQAEHLLCELSVLLPRQYTARKSMVLRSDISLSV